MLDWTKIKFLNCRLCDGPLNDHIVMGYGPIQSTKCDGDICGYCLYRFEIHVNNTRNSRLATLLNHSRGEFLRSKGICDCKSPTRFEEYRRCDCLPLSKKFASICDNVDACAEAWTDYLHLRDEIQEKPPITTGEKERMFLMWLTKEMRLISRGKAPPQPPSSRSNWDFEAIQSNGK